MNIIQLNNIVDGFAIIDFSGINMSEILKTGDISTLNGKSFNWNRSNGIGISDSPFYIGSFPIFETEKLGNALMPYNVNTATILVEGKSYTMVSAYHMIGDIINKNKSECHSFRSGKIMSVKKYVFEKGLKYPMIFTPEEYPVCTFCQEQVAKALKGCGFEQLILTQCELG